MILKSLINKAIDASIVFEALMDSIDFNSYLPEEEEWGEVKKTERYRTYKSMLRNALKPCEKVVDKLPNEIKKILPPKDPPDENKRTQYLVYQLFEAKKLRLEARWQTKWKEEKNKYIEATDKLHKVFISVPPEDFYGEVGNIYDKNNWARVLYYNEMAICHSGLTESSMSLGYAEAAISILEKIRPELRQSQANIEYEDDRVFKLYTFALCNKGEAERNLHDYDKALSTFKTIIDKFKPENIVKSSDCNQALFRLALIFTDQGRSVEAIEVLKGMKVRKKDTRYGGRDLERASALIDQKEYIDYRERRGAYGFLKPYINRDEWKNTFVRRKAKVYELRLLIEFKKHLPEDFETPKMKEIKSTYNTFKRKSTDLLRECAERFDGDLFRKTCTNLADYFHEKKDSEMELKCYYLYLCNKAIFEKRDGLEKKSKTPNKIIDDWISKKKLKKLKSLIEEYENKRLVKFSEVLIDVDDEHYLGGFFETYMRFCKEKSFARANKKEKEIIQKLKKRLIDVYHEKDNLIEKGKVEEIFSLYEGKINRREESEAKVTETSVEFVKKCFFQRESFDNDKKSIFLGADSILARMEQNTFAFSEKIVGKTKRFPPDETFRGILTVLRRWNSFTPALASSVNPSKGGGYFLYFWHKDSSLGIHKDSSLGIVVDPGYDFLDNLFSQGYRIGDIDAVIVSHAHPDHTDNLLPIISLFHELNGRLGKYYNERKFGEKQFNKKHLKLIISQGVFDQYYKLIKPSKESLKDIFVVKMGRNGKNNAPCYKHEFDKNHSLKIVPFATSHRDLSQWESLGFIIKINDNGTPRQIGYTSDAHWKQDFSKNFEGCHIICAHLGSIVDILGGKAFCSLCGNYNENKSGNCKTYDKCKEENFKNGKPSKEKLLKQAQEQSHLYLSGLTMFFDELLSKKKMELAVISEFGEELKSGIRMDLYHKFDDWFQNGSEKKTRCLPGDIGLEIDLLNSNILCCCCQEFKSKDIISPIAYGKEEGIFFICDECNSVLSTYQIEEKLKDYSENGRKLELADESK